MSTVSLRLENVDLDRVSQPTKDALLALAAAKSEVLSIEFGTALNGTRLSETVTTALRKLLSAFVIDSLDATAPVKGVAAPLSENEDPTESLDAPAIEPLGQRKHGYSDSTPLLHVGDSSFEGWFQSYPHACEPGIKQIARDAYAAGMGDPLVTYASAEMAVAGKVLQYQYGPKGALATATILIEDKLSNAGTDKMHQGMLVYFAPRPKQANAGTD